MITTVTLNAVIDKTYHIASFSKESTNRVTKIHQKRPPIQQSEEIKRGDVLVACDCSQGLACPHSS